MALQAAAAEEAAAHGARKKSRFAAVYEEGLCIERHLLLLQQQQLQQHLRVARDRFGALLAAAAAAAATAQETAAGATTPEGPPAAAEGAPEGREEALNEDAAAEQQPHHQPQPSAPADRSLQQQQQQQQQQDSREEQQQDNPHQPPAAAAAGVNVKSELLDEGPPGAPLPLKRSFSGGPGAGGGPSSPRGRRRTLRRGPRVGAPGALCEIDSLVRPTGIGLSLLGASSVPLSVASSKQNMNPYEHHALHLAAFCLSFSSLYANNALGGPHAGPPTQGGPGGGALQGDLYQGPLEGLHGEGPPFLGPLSDATAADLMIGRRALRLIQQRERGPPQGLPLEDGGPCSSSSSSSARGKKSSSSSRSGFVSCYIHCGDAAAAAAAAEGLPDIDAGALARAVPSSLSLSPRLRGPQKRKARSSRGVPPRERPTHSQGAPSSGSRGAPPERVPSQGGAPEGPLISRSGRRSVPPSIYDA